MFFGRLKPEIYRIWYSGQSSTKVGPYLSDLHI
jgi:hypothetical protein